MNLIKTYLNIFLPIQMNFTYNNSILTFTILTYIPYNDITKPFLTLEQFGSI